GLSNENYNADLFGIGDLSLGLFAGVANISSEAYIDVKKSAQLIATEDVNLSVESDAIIDTMVGPTLASAAFGGVKNTARLTIADGVLIQGKN
ncbi:hypothetical protein, partial [Clostridium perfringens]|uniref:hypothetical protein n=1 Tax=Clostridium perfringens TaxID=1502 RepID=UPI003754CD06